MTYHLTAYSPWEGYRVLFNGTRGRLELLSSSSRPSLPLKAIRYPSQGAYAVRWYVSVAPVAYRTRTAMSSSMVTPGPNTFWSRW